MGKKRHSVEQIVRKMREAEVELAKVVVRASCPKTQTDSRPARRDVSHRSGASDPGSD